VLLNNKILETGLQVSLKSNKLSLSENLPHLGVILPLFSE